MIRWLTLVAIISGCSRSPSDEQRVSTVDLARMPSRVVPFHVWHLPVVPLVEFDSEQVEAKAQPDYPIVPTHPRVSPRFANRGQDMSAVRSNNSVVSNRRLGAVRGRPAHNEISFEIDENEQQQICDYIAQYANAGIRHCWEDVPFSQDLYEGEILVDFIIMANGTVGSIRSKDQNSALSICIAGIIGNLVFPKPTRGKAIKFSYTFIFNDSE